jgi:hypothetical protein
MPNPDRLWITPPQYAQELGVKPATILDRIRSGELVAIDMAKPGSKRPRYRIHRSEAVAFEQRRTAGPTPKPQRRRKRDTSIIAFF